MGLEEASTSGHSKSGIKTRFSRPIHGPGGAHPGVCIVTDLGRSKQCRDSLILNPLQLLMAHLCLAGLLSSEVSKAFGNEGLMIFPLCTLDYKMKQERHRAMQEIATTPCGTIFIATNAFRHDSRGRSTASSSCPFAVDLWILPSGPMDPWRRNYGGVVIPRLMALSICKRGSESTGRSLRESAAAKSRPARRYIAHGSRYSPGC